MRLQKYIAMTGLCSRRKAEALIVAGEIMVNGNIVRELGTKVAIEDKVSYRGKELLLEKKEYYLLNKPAGYTCSLSDPNADKLVINLIDSDSRIFPVGRLDKDSEGLLILTNDGDFANRVIHPSKKIAKKYELVLKKNLSEEQENILKKGFLLDDKPANFSEIKLINKNKNTYHVVIYQGRKRQIRRMIEQVANAVVYLKRIQIGHLKLLGLPLGSYRPLMQKEIDFF